MWDVAQSTSSNQDFLSFACELSRVRIISGYTNIVLSGVQGIENGLCKEVRIYGLIRVEGSSGQNFWDRRVDGELVSGVPSLASSKRCLASVCLTF